MTFQFPHIPESDEQLPQWLSRKMVGPDLGELVSELSVFNDTNGERGPTLTEVVGDQLEGILGSGLDVLEPQRLRQLLRHPRLLLELQEQVLIAGGDYWQEACREGDDLSDVRQLGEARLQSFLHSEAEASPIEQVVPINRRPWFVSVATAAAVLLVVLVFQQVRQTRLGSQVDPSLVETVVPPPPQFQTGEDSPVVYADIPSDAWGWAIPGAIPDEISGEEYFLVLADLAEQWFDESPDDAPGVARRITEFRQGCSLLFLSEHRPLMDADRKWLIRSCREWAVELETHLAELEDGEKDFRLVRSEMDDTVDRFVVRLRKWAPIAKRREQRQTG